MDIKSLRYFLAVTEEGNITKAAKRLCIAQPPLSRQIQLLEEELGVVLFERGKRRIQLTEEGRYLKRQAEEILALVEKTRSQLGQLGSGVCGQVSIGVVETCGGSILPGLVEGFHAQYPEVYFQIWSGNGDETTDKLNRNLVDMAILREPFYIEQCESIFLRQEPWVAVMSKDHPLAEGIDEIELSALRKEPLMISVRPSLQDEILNWFNEISEERNIFCYYNSVASVIPMVEHGAGIAISPESVKSFTSGRNLVYKKIIHPQHDSRLYLVRHRYQMLPAAAGTFWDFAKKKYCDKC